jgi:hypothetical protein
MRTLKLKRPELQQAKPKKLFIETIIGIPEDVTYGILERFNNFFI